MKRIEYIGAPELARIQDLRRNSGLPAKHFAVEGLRFALTALENGAAQQPLICLLSESFVQRQPNEVESIERALPSNCSMLLLTDKIFARFAETKQPQGVMLIYALPGQEELQRRTETVLALRQARLLVLEHVQDPGNVGSVIRSAEAFGYDAVFWGEATADPYRGKVLRATVGAAFHIPLIPFSDTRALLSVMREVGVATIAADLRGQDLEQFLSGSDVREGGIALILGNEANGIKPATLEHCEFRVKITMKGRSESLNVAAAAAIMAYRFMK